MFDSYKTVSNDWYRSWIKRCYPEDKNNFFVCVIFADPAKNFGPQAAHVHTIIGEGQDDHFTTQDDTGLTLCAEQNAVFNAIKKKNGNLIPGSTLVVPRLPCPRCALMISRLGIEQVICWKKIIDSQILLEDIWRYNDLEKSSNLFLDNDVELILYNGDIDESRESTY